MESLPLRSYRLEFARRAEWRREDERRVQIDIKERDKRRDDEREKRMDALEDMALAVLATDTQVADFTVKLDAYDAATVEALMDNQKELDQVREELRVLLDKAYVLPDGRRVFKTEDGTRVFDEHGAEVEDIDPAEIENWRPYWERYDSPFKQEFALTEERGKLLEFQKLSDDTRAEIKEDGTTAKRLDELETILAKDAPEAVKRRMTSESRPQLESGNDPQANREAEGPQPAAVPKPAARLDMPTF